MKSVGESTQSEPQTSILTKYWILDKMAAILANNFKCIYLNESNRSPIAEIGIQNFGWQWASVGLGNGSAPSRRQAITWTNDEPVRWRIYAVLGGDEPIIWTYRGSAQVNSKYDTNMTIRYSTTRCGLVTPYYWRHTASGILLNTVSRNGLACCLMVLSRVSFGSHSRIVLLEYSKYNPKSYVKFTHLKSHPHPQGTVI